jgi:hypothetical protein
MSFVRCSCNAMQVLHVSFCKAGPHRPLCIGARLGLPSTRWVNMVEIFEAACGVYVLRCSILRFVATLDAIRRRCAGCDSRSIAQGTLFKPPTGKLCHVFISHAGEQKAGFVDVLWQEFGRKYPVLKVFVDELSLQKGEGAMPAINRALGDAFVGAWHLACLPHSVVHAQWGKVPGQMGAGLHVLQWQAM